MAHQNLRVFMCQGTGQVLNLVNKAVYTKNIE